MIHIPRHKRLSALGMLLVTNFGFFVLPIEALNSQKVAFLLAMIITVAAAFGFSEIALRFKIERRLYRYGVPGGLGLITGIIGYVVLHDSAFLSMEWLNSYGKYTLIALNIICALFLFFFKTESKLEDSRQKAL